MYSLKDVEKAVSQAFEISSWDLHSESKRWHLAQARWAVFALAGEFTKVSQVQAGVAFGRDHSTVIHGVRRIREMLAELHPITLKIAQAREILKLMTPARERMAAAIAANPLPASSPDAAHLARLNERYRTQSATRAAGKGSRRRQLVLFAQAHAATGARP